MPFVGLVDGERTFSNATFCTFKLRKLESSYRGNATESSTRVYYIPINIAPFMIWGNGIIVFIILLDVGWLALLILRKRQCEGLNVGIGTEE